MTGLFYIVVLAVHISYHLDNINYYIKQSDISLSTITFIRSNTFSIKICAVNESICLDWIVSDFETESYLSVNIFDSCYLEQLSADWILILLMCRLSDSIVCYIVEIQSFLTRIKLVNIQTDYLKW